MSHIPFIKKEINEEEDTEDKDETEGDEHDPEQIVQKTYNIKGEDEGRLDLSGSYGKNCWEIVSLSCLLFCLCNW